MPETHPPNHYEIDLLEIFQTLWNGKWIILAPTLISLLAMFGYLSSQKVSFKATTEIRPIPSSIEEIYMPSNDLGFFKVSSVYLVNKYIEQLEERTVFEEGIVKYELLDPKNFDDEQTFNQAVVKFASEIEILPPINVDGENKGTMRRNWLIEGEYYDKNKWKQLLSYVDSSTNQNVRNFLQKSFENALVYAKQKEAFNIEDINTKIMNALSDGDRETSDRLAYLREQAAIARKLGVAKNTLEAQTFGIKNNMIANLQTKTPYYLRGYEAIEKEIKLMEERQNKKAFIPTLLKLEQEKRKFKQDGILLDRAEALYKNTPIIKGDDFLAASVSVGATKFKQDKNSMMLVSPPILSGMIASIYLLISNAMRRRKDNSVKA